MSILDPPMELPFPTPMLKQLNNTVLLVFQTRPIGIPILQFEVQNHAASHVAHRSVQVSRFFYTTRTVPFKLVDSSALQLQESVIIM
jgi:hypothetical protein